MPITPTAFVAGTRMLAADMRTELTKIRAWLTGALLASDFFDRAVSKYAVYRPDTFGFPKENSEGVLTQVAERAVGLVSAPTIGSDFYTTGNVGGLDSDGARIDSLRDRLTIFLEHLLEDDRFIIIGTRLHIPGTSDVEIEATLFAGTQYDWNDNSTSAYPDNAGNVRLRYTLVGSDVAVDVHFTVRKLNATYYNQPEPSQVGRAWFGMGNMIEDLAPGVYDFWIEYRRNGADLDQSQVIIVSPTIVIETHEQ